MTVLRPIIIAMLVGGVLTGCSDDSPAGGANLCGEGDEIYLDDGTQVCVFPSALVVENGFRCPESLPDLQDLGPVGFCSAGELPEGARRETANKHREEKVELWTGRCGFNDECGDKETCESGYCGASCPDGLTRVEDSSSCLQDDATCYELPGGGWCTGQAEPGCAEGETLVENDSYCVQDDATCYELASGGWCTGPSDPVCPEGFIQVETEVECIEGYSCFLAGFGDNGPWCTGDGCSALAEDACQTKAGCAPIVGQMCVGEQEWEAVVSGCYLTDTDCLDIETCAVRPEDDVIIQFGGCTPAGWVDQACPLDFCGGA